MTGLGRRIAGVLGAIVVLGCVFGGTLLAVHGVRVIEEDPTTGVFASLLGGVLAYTAVEAIVDVVIEEFREAKRKKWKG